MDKKTILGLVIIFVIILGFSYFNRPSEEELARLQAQRDSVARVQAADEAQRLAEERTRIVQDSVFGTPSTPVDSLFYAGGESRQLILENDKLKVEFNTLGAYPRSVQIRGYKTYYGDSLLLFKESQYNTLALHFLTTQSSVATSEQQFQCIESSHNKVLGSGDTARIVFRLPVQHAGGYLEYIYSLAYGSYAMQWQIRFVNMEAQLAMSTRYLDLHWTMRTPQQEKGAKKELEYTTAAYYTTNGDYEQLDVSDKAVEEKVNTKVSWLAYKEQFFSAILRSEQGFEQTDIKVEPTNEEGYLRQYSSTLMLPFSGGKEDSYKLEFYYGPNLYKTLAAFEHEYERVIPLGGWLVGWINKYVVINVFYWLSKYISNYGLIILILTLLIKIVIFPLTFKSYLSQAKMRLLKPKVDEINAKYSRKEDATKRGQATMELYKRAGANPLGGCLPILIQFPILIAMFRFFPASFELRQESFLWADDLSSYDAIVNLPFSIPFYGDHVSLFTLLMAASLFISSQMNYRLTGSSNAQMPGMKFMMLYMMPIMMLFWFNDYSSGLSYYYFLATLITIAQTYLIRFAVDEKKMLARLQQNASRPQKKSGFMYRLQELQKEQARRAKR